MRDVEAPARGEHGEDVAKPDLVWLVTPVVELGRHALDEQQLLERVERRVLRNVRAWQTAVIIGLGAVQAMLVVLVAPVEDRVGNGRRFLRRYAEVREHVVEHRFVHPVDGYLPALVRDPHRHRRPPELDRMPLAVGLDEWRGELGPDLAALGGPQRGVIGICQPRDAACASVQQCRRSAPCHRPWVAWTCAEAHADDPCAAGARDDCGSCVLPRPSPVRCAPPRRSVRCPAPRRCRAASLGVGRRDVARAGPTLRNTRCAPVPRRGSSRRSTSTGTW